MEQAAGGKHDAATMLRTTLAGKLSFTNLWGASDAEAQQERDAPQDEQREGAPDEQCLRQPSLPWDEQPNNTKPSVATAAATAADADVEMRDPTDEPREDVEAPPTSTIAATDNPPTEQSDNLECDFDTNPTALYISLLKKEWSNTIVRARASPEEAKTWVSRAESDGSLRWRLLPIHAAIIFRAPENVVEALLDAYPSASQKRDDQGMLPLHLAFRNDASENTVNILLHAYPGSVEVKDRKGRTPIDIAQSSNSAIRDIYLHLLTSLSSISSSSTGEEEHVVETASKGPVAVEAAQSEQRAKFDAELMEVSKNHKTEMGFLQMGAQAKTVQMDSVVENLKEELAKAEGKAEVLTGHVQDLEDALTCKSTERRRLETKANTLDAKLKNVAANSDEIVLLVDKERLEKEKSSLEGTLEQTKRDLAEANKHIEELRKDFDDRLQTWVRRCMKLEEDNKTIKEESVADLRAENEQLLKEKALLEAEFQDYERGQVAAVTEQINALEKNYEERIEEWKQKAKETSALKSQDAEIEEWKSKAAEWKS